MHALTILKVFCRTWYFYPASTLKPATATLRLLLLAITALTNISTVQAQSSSASSQNYVLWNRNYNTAPVDKFVQLALDKTEDLYPAAQLVKSSPMEQNAAIESMREEYGLDIMSAASSAKLDPEFLTLHFPVLKGLLGQRLCLIRHGDQDRFTHIYTTHDFHRNKIKVCQGEYWPDTDILRRNGLDVVTSPTYSELFSLVEQGECDCFLRGAQEIGPELKAHQKSLTLEANLLLSYHQPGVIYIRKDKPDLAIRIELGLLRALEDGSYDALLRQLLHPSLQQLQLDKRRQIVLNPAAISPVSAIIRSIPEFDFTP